ncbi:MAG: alcohol dehydrogenase AdhP [Labilithrix sp.]|nr:alcohol dehydrogenase AdhP [Labilithrix sp.]
MNPRTMHAAVAKSFGAPLSLVDLAVPEPGRGEVLVRIHASGVCHTDLHAADGDWPVKPTLPFIPGHEGAGVVEAVGAGVTQVGVGDRVGIAWLHDACGSCGFCLAGRESLCPQQHNSGYSVNGAFAQYAIARADFATRIPAGLGFAEAAPVLCAGVTTYKGLKETQARPGEWVVISGIGGLGHMAVQYALAMGLRVAAVDVADDKLELAKRLGAEIVVNAKKDDPAARLQAEIGGAHASLVTAVSTAAFAAGIDVLRRGGTCVLVGLPPGEFPAPIFDVVLKGITIRGSIVGTRLDLDEALDFAARGKVRATFATYPLAKVNDVLDGLRRGTIEGRAVLDLER